MTERSGFGGRAEDGTIEGAIWDGATETASEGGAAFESYDFASSYSSRSTYEGLGSFESTSSFLRPDFQKDRVSVILKSKNYGWFYANSPTSLAVVPLNRFLLGSF